MTESTLLLTLAVLAGLFVVMSLVIFLADMIFDKFSGWRK